MTKCEKTGNEELGLKFEKYEGDLMPTFVQDVETGEVLMGAGVTPEALKKTIETGLATFYSRTENELWTKGLTSGDTLSVEEIRTDCDQDALLYLVRVNGTGACHKEGWGTCFRREVDMVSGRVSSVLTPRKKWLKEPPLFC